MITELTGIAHAQVANAPTPTQALLRFAEFAGAGAVMLAHNGLRFDFPFLHHTCLQNGLGVGPTNAIDSMHLSKQLWGKGGKHSLQEVIKRLGISTAGVRCHDARGDVHLLGQAVRQIWKQLNMDFQTCPVVEGKGVLPLLV
jgi:DNA polymerase III alpha subunit (gram-positive type)